MGRPSLAVERTEQIVLAACRCVARFGLDDATLEQISEESGLSRGHIRHYVGSRDNLMILVWARVSETFLSRLSYVDSTDPREHVTQLLDRLYEDGGSHDPTMPAVGDFLLSGAHQDVLRPKIDKTMSRIEAVLDDSLRRLVPDASPDDRSAVVGGMLRLLLGSSAYTAVSGREDENAIARASADRLVQSLGVAALSHY
jgi:AcrR family transcriptional regulator